jgi:zinc transporter ZupT
VGGVLGYFALAQVGGLLPFVLAIAASNFMYIALSDLIPQLHAQADGSGHGHGHTHTHAHSHSSGHSSTPEPSHHAHNHDHNSTHSADHDSDHDYRANEGHVPYHPESSAPKKMSAAWLQPILMLAGVGLAYVATSLLHSH